MYLPGHFEQTNIDDLRALMQQHAFATLITQIDNDFNADHLPFDLHLEPDGCGTLRCHVSRANPLWQHCVEARACMVIFQGDHAYISPSWYPQSKRNVAVPTWNYAVVHVHGQARAIEDKDWLLQHLARLTQRHENQLAMPWQIDDMETKVLHAKLKGIVGLEIRIDKLMGKWKLSQNRDLEDRMGVVVGLRETGSPSAVATADLVESNGTQQV